MVMRVNATSSSSAAICAMAVTAPWPSSTLPENTVTEPGGSNRTQRSSRGLALRSPGSILDRPEDADMGAAAAEIAVERRDDLLVARGLFLLQQRVRRHQDAVDAIAALGGLLVDERLLQGVGFFPG